MNAVEFGNLLNRNDDKFIDLGLDSGTKWGGNDLIIYRDNIILSLDCPFYEHIKDLGYQFPTREQFNELFYSCSCKLYNKCGIDFIVVKSRVNNNFLRFCIPKSFLLRDELIKNIPYNINIKSTYFPQIATKREAFLYNDLLTNDLIFVKDK